MFFLRVVRMLAVTRVDTGHALTHLTPDPTTTTTQTRCDGEGGQPERYAKC